MSIKANQHGSLKASRQKRADQVSSAVEAVGKPKNKLKSLPG